MLKWNEALEIESVAIIMSIKLSKEISDIVAEMYNKFFSTNA